MKTTDTLFRRGAFAGIRPTATAAEAPATPATSLDVTAAERRRLPNGVALYLLPADEFEVLRVSFVFRAGSVHQQVPFSASATANLLAEGTRDLTAAEVAERLDYYGSWYDVSIDRDYVYISFAMLSRFAAETLAVAEQVLLRPVFPEEEVAAYCAERRQRLAIERRKVDVEAREAFARALFGPEHPYGIAADEAAYERLTRDDVAAFYERQYTAPNCFVVCSGRIDPAAEEAVAAIAAQLPEGLKAGEAAADGTAAGATEATGATETAAAEASPFAGADTRSFPAPATQHEARVAHPGAVQSSIRIGRLLFPRRHPDFAGMQVVAAALGGYFGSRLMQNLRERNGYTYGVVAAMVNFERAGYLAVAAQVGTEVTGAALDEIYAEIERLRTELLPDEELALVKRIMEGEMMRILDGPFGIADVTIENLLCGTDNGAIDRNLALIRATTPEDVRRLARKYLAREDLVTVVAGDSLS